MKRRLLILIITICFMGCEDVIDLDLNTAEPRLVIDASISWFKNSTGNQQSIRLSLTAPFFDEAVPPANNAIVVISDTNGNIFNFIEDGDTGIYRNTNFIPVIDATYVLTVDYNGEIYMATETLKSVVTIDSVEQNNDGGFSGEDIELKAFFHDPPIIENYYFFEFINDISVSPDLAVYEDRFTDGNQMFGFYTEEDIETGNVVTIRNYGVSEQFYQFMFTLLQQGSEDSGGPFETQPSTVRGNCINQTNPDNFPLGYFRLSEVDEFVYIIE